MKMNEMFYLHYESTWCYEAKDWSSRRIPCKRRLLNAKKDIVQWLESIDFFSSTFFDQVGV